MKRKKILIAIFALSIIALTTALFHRTREFYKQYSLGRRHFQKSEYSSALDFFLRALNEEPESPEALMYAARSYLKLGEDDKAAEMLDALAKSPHAEKRQLEEAADYYYAMGRYARAEELYRRLLEAGYRERETAFKLAESLRPQQKYEEAIRLYEKYLED